jgi:hypothetical protein
VPLVIVRVPLPAQEPDRAWNGVVEACTDAGRVTRANAPAKARFFKDVLNEYIETLPLEFVFLME